MANEYIPRPIDTSEKEVPRDLVGLVDRLAKNTHENWAKMRIAEGWEFGESNDEAKKRNPLLKPYEEMTDQQKNMDILANEETIKLLLSLGYTIEPAERDKKLRWNDAKSELWGKYYGDAALPEMRVPLLIGLSGQEYSDINFSELHKAMDKFFTETFEQFGISQNESKRCTPVYLLSSLSTSTERLAARYAAEKYAVGCIHITADAQEKYGVKRVVTPDPEGYIAYNSFMLLALWDGADTLSNTGHMVKKMLLETESAKGDSMPNEAFIGDSRPVYQIVLPKSGIDPRFFYRTRRILPYVLESGSKWYLINRAVLVGDELVSDTDVKSDVESGQEKRLDELKAELDAFDSLSAEGRTHAGCRPRKAIEKDIAAITGKIKKRKKYNSAVTEHKSARFAANADGIRIINSHISRKCTRADKEEVYELLESPMRGLVKAADATHIRHIRLDSMASYLQKKHKRQTVAIAVCAGLGLFSYALFSDLVEPHSAAGALLGLTAAVFIIIALCIYFAMQKKSSRTGHANLRLLSEGLRVKTFWNALGYYEENADAALTAKTRMDLEYAAIAFRGWKVLDEADGYYSQKTCGKIYPSEIIRKWIGSADERDEATGQYDPTKDGQIVYARNSSYKAQPKANKLEKSKMLVSVIAVVLTLVLSVYLAARFVIGVTTSGMPQGVDKLFGPVFESPDLLNHIENFVMLAVSVIPLIATCSVMYTETRMYPENVKRYKWLALQYQKLLSQYDGLFAEESARMQLDQNGVKPSVTEVENSISAQRKEILTRAGKMAISEVGEWTIMTSGNDVNLPF